MYLFLKNTVANLMGRGWLAILNLLCTPLYVTILGIESYGLIGFFNTLQALIVLFYEGLDVVINRELSDCRNNSESHPRDAIRTIEIISWATSIIIIVIFVFVAPTLSTHWITSKSLSDETISISLILLAIAIGIELPGELYLSGLKGLQRQGVRNIIYAGSATVRVAGGLLVLWQISPTVQVYALWQIVVAALSTIVSAPVLYKYLPKTKNRARFDVARIRREWRFYLGTCAIAFLFSLLTQIDKIVLSRQLSLDLFGYYALAWTLCASLVSLLVFPPAEAAFPQMSYLFKTGNETELTKLYHTTTQITAVLLIPVVTVVFFFSKEILYIWTGDLTTAEMTSPIMQLLIIGMALRGINIIPKNLQFAYGWTRLTLVLHIITVIVAIPLISFTASNFGAVGGAASSVVLWSSYTVIGVWFMHRRILKGEQMRWYVSDLSLPLVSSIALLELIKYLIPMNISRGLMLIYILTILSFCMLSAILIVADMRNHLVRLVLDRR